MIFEKVEEAFDLIESLTKNMNEKSIESSKQLDNDKNDKKDISKLDDPEYLTDVEIFNKLMFEYAKIGKTSKIYLLFKKMRSVEEKSKQITPNINSYTAALQSIGYQFRSKIYDDRKESSGLRLQVERIIWDIKKLGVNI